MKDKGYFARDLPAAAERERLSLLEQLADPIAARRLSRLGVGPGWRCLDVGAGTGSVARWLAECVGPSGQVVATDLNPRFLVGLGLPNLEARRHDILEDDLEAAHYDLVHCRAVLMHLPDPWRALRRMAAAVRPGGWLLVQELDFGSFGACDPGHPRAAEFDRIARATCAAVRAVEFFDPCFGRRVHALVEELRLEGIGYGETTLNGRGGGSVARNCRLRQDLLRGPLVATGVLTEEDFDELGRAYDDPSFWFVGFTVFAAWGRRPANAVPCAAPGSWGGTEDRNASLPESGVMATGAAESAGGAEPLTFE
jgi:SAM-dependent methyltransferase